MLKVIGAVCILTGVAGISGSINRRIKMHYQQLMRLKELMTLLGNELQYLKVPLPAALKKISDRLEEPFCGSFGGMAQMLLTYEEARAHKVWKDVLLGQREKYLLSDEEFQIFLDAGAILEQENGYMQGEEVKIFVEQVNFKAARAREELASKQKICRYLCGAFGIFLILLLV